MKSIFAALIFAVFALSGSPSQAKEREIKVINWTGYGIKFLGFNPPGDDDWSESEIDETMNNGDDVDVSFDTDEEGCKWDIRVDWADAGYPGVLWRNVDVCEIRQITLHYDRKSDTTSISTK